MLSMKDLTKEIVNIISENKNISKDDSAGMVYSSSFYDISQVTPDFVFEYAVEYWANYIIEECK